MEKIVDKLIKKYERFHKEASKWIEDAGNQATLSHHEGQIVIIDKVLRDLKRLKKNENVR